MIVEGPEGDIEFPDGMSLDEIDSIMRERYDGGEAAPAQTNPLPDAALEESSAKDKDIGFSALQGLRDAGEWLLAAPEEVDQLERSAINWLKQAGKDNPNEITRIMNRVGGNWETFYNTLGGGDLPLPNKDDMSWLTTQATGVEPYQPQTSEGQAMEMFMQGLPAGGAGAGLFGSLGGGAMRGLGKYAPFAGAGFVGSQMDKIYDGVKGFFTDPEFGMTPMKGNPGLSPMLPVR